MEKSFLIAGIIVCLLLSCNNAIKENTRKPIATSIDSSSKITESESREDLKLRTDAITKLDEIKILKSKSDTISFFKDAIKYRDSIERNIDALILTKFDSSSDSSEGGEILTYSNKNDILKIKGVFYGETGQNHYEFYLKNKKIIAVKETIKDYKLPIGNENVRIVINKAVAQLFILNGNKILTSYGKNTTTDFDYEQRTIDILDIFREIQLDINK